MFVISVVDFICFRIGSWLAVLFVGLTLLVLLGCVSVCLVFDYGLFSGYSCLVSVVRCVGCLILCDFWIFVFVICCCLDLVGYCYCCLFEFVACYCLVTYGAYLQVVRLVCCIWIGICCFLMFWLGADLRFVV